MQKTYRTIESYQHVILFYEKSSDIDESIFIKDHGHLTCIFVADSSSTITIEVSLVGPGASVAIFGICLISGNDTVKLLTKQEHAVAGSKSQVVVKSVLAENATMDYSGTIMIDKLSYNSVAWQHNKNILLTPYARVRSEPNLQVLNNQVQCAHGSATGQIDSDQLFYMSTRGMATKKAKMLLLQGFFADILKNIENTEHRQKIDETIKKRLSYLVSGQ